MKYCYMIATLICLSYINIYIDAYIINPEKNNYNNLEISNSIIKALDIIERKSYFPVSIERAVNKAIDACASIDQYSCFLNCKDYQELKKVTRGQFFGVGVILEPKQEVDDEFLLVTDVIPGSPAYKKGIKKYDKILSIDSEPIKLLATEEAAQKLRGSKRYSTVRLEVLRNAKDYKCFTIERDIINEQHIHCYLLEEQNIIYASINLFTHQTADQLRTALDKTLSYNTKAIILDLRDNSGGVLTQAVKCAELFLAPNSLVVFTKDKDQNILEKFYTKNLPLIHKKLANKNIVIFLLVNERTASAAEIFVKALSVHSIRAKNISPFIFILGTQTQGKGSVQEIIPINDNCAIKITTCLYFPPDNSSIESIGIMPDFTVEQKYPATRKMKNLAKLCAGKKTDIIDNEKLNTKTIEDQHLEQIRQDYQIETCINLASFLNLGLQVFKNKISTHSQALNFLQKNYVFNNNTKLKTVTLQ